MQSNLEHILYIISKLFHVPVLLVLMALLAFILFQFGIFMADLIKRIRTKTAFTEKAVQKIRNFPLEDSQDRELAFARIVHEAQEDNGRKIQSTKYCVKLGPTVGLIGTLAPMAKALSGLSAGNFASLSEQMVTAFSTTILGLVVGALAYTIAHFRIQWQRSDRFVLESAAEEFYNLKTNP